MNRCLKMELARAFANRRMLPAVSFGLVLSIWHYFIYIFPLRGCVLAGGYPLSAYNKWLGGESYSLQSTLFYLLIPLACAYPYGGSWLYDCTSSVGGQAIVRGGKRDFICAKLFVSFLNGAVIAILPLWFDFALTSTTFPAIMPQAGLGLSPIGPGALMGNLFYIHPFLYVSAYILLNGLFLGLLNTFTIAARLFTRNKYMVLLMPFICYMALHCAGTTLGRFEICPSGFLRPCQQFRTSWAILGMELLVMLAAGILSAVKYIREEHGLL